MGAVKPEVVTLITEGPLQRSVPEQSVAGRRMLGGV